MKIAIGRLGHIGDIIACEPVSRYLRHKYPQARLTWVVENAYRELIDANPHIDETVVAACTTDWIRLASHGAYDEVVDLHPNYRMCSHCRVPLIKTQGNPFVSIHDFLDYGTLLEAFSIGAGLPKLSAAPQVYLRPEHAAAVDALGLPADYCVIHRQSTSSEKDWSLADWRAVADRIARDLRIPIVEIGASAQAAPSPLADLAIDLVNRTSLLATAEVIRRARFFVGVDSAPAHLANAVRTPGVVLLGRLGVFRSYMPFNGYYAGDVPEVKLVRNLAGPVRDIPVADVMAAIRQVSGAAAERGGAAAPGTARPQAAAEVTEAERRLVRASGLFEPSWYVVHHPEAAAAGTDPLDHFLAVGGALGFSPGPAFDVPRYLTRHGDVARSGRNPLLHFLDHGQADGRPSQGADALPPGGLPRIFAFCDAGSPAATREQVRLAIDHGISGFVLRHGPLGGEARLRDAFESHSGWDMRASFALLWANDDGSRQHRSEEDDLASIRALVPVFRDERYAKVAGKPVLLVHDAARSPKLRRMADSWRGEIAEHGFPGLYLVTADDGAADRPHPRLLRFDAAYEAPCARVPGAPAGDDYRTFARSRMGRPSPEYKRFPTVMLPGDASRQGTEAAVDARIRPGAYRLWLTQALLDTHRHCPPGERLVFLQSWSDGPMARHHLEETRDALADARAALGRDETGAGGGGATAALLARIEREKDLGAFGVVQATQDRANRIQRELHIARAQLAAERRALAKLHASTSWRVTAPLRWATEGLRAALRRVRGH